MENSGGIQASLSGRYARALFDLAVENKALDSVSNSVGALKRALAESTDLRTVTTNPMIGRKDATNAMGAVAKAMKLDALTSNFLAVLAGNSRLSALPAIITAFSALAANHRGEVTAQVTTAHPLDAAQTKALAAKLKAKMGKDVAIEATTNPDILGGLIVKIGSQMIDNSIATKLNTLAIAMKG
jgi:F-type H+-transporting ATPase subunit delta